MATKKRAAAGQSSRVSLLMAVPREVGAAEFKARCLELVNEVERLGTEIVITKHRKPVARLLPAQSTSPRFVGSLAGVVIEERDIVSPTGEHWTGDESNLT
jgi:prevent-host-death family protein